MRYLNENIFGARSIGEEELAALSRVVREKRLFRFCDGAFPSECQLLEDELSNYVRAPSALAVSNGTAALRAGLVAGGVRHGDIVGVSALTFVATANAVASLGAFPLPIDLDAHLGVDLEDLGKTIGMMKMFIPVYLPGHSSNMEEVMALAGRHDVLVLEDACQALGVTAGRRSAGSHGELGVFSFQQNKQITAGEGGMLVGRVEWVERARRYSDHGAVRNSAGVPDWSAVSAGIGENLRMAELQAAILRPQLARLPLLLDRQRAARETIRPLVQSWPISIIESCDRKGDSGAYLAFLGESLEQADSLIKAAQREGVLLRRFWPEPITKVMPLGRYVAGGPTARWWSARRAEDWAGRLLALPIPPDLEDERLDALLEAILRVGDGMERA